MRIINDINFKENNSILPENYLRNNVAKPTEIFSRINCIIFIDVIRLIEFLLHGYHVSKIKLNIIFFPL